MYTVLIDWHHQALICHLRSIIKNIFWLFFLIMLCWFERAILQFR